MHPLNYVANDYEDNGGGKVMDHATGLMWEPSGSDKRLSYRKAKAYIRNLNMKRVAV